MKHKNISPLRAYVSDLWSALVENAKWHRAMRSLHELEWSTDYIIYLIQMADRKDVKITIENKGVVLTLEKVKGIETEFKEPEGIRAFRHYVGAE
jgi:hypothetical protein